MTNLKLKKIRITFGSIVFNYKNNKKDSFEELNINVSVPYSEDKKSIPQRAISTAISLLMYATEKEDDFQSVDVDFNRITIKEF